MDQVAFAMQDSLAGMRKIPAIWLIHSPLAATAMPATSTLRVDNSIKNSTIHLPRDPGRSDVEVFLDTPWTLVLAEEGERTLQGLIGSTKPLLEATAKDLLDLWQWRRDHPGSLRQPAAQWPNGRSTQSTGFNGYAPGTLELAPGMAMVHPVSARRFHAAALDDLARPQWATFD